LKHLIAAVAIKAHGALVAWGNAFNGGDTTEVADRLTSGVVTVFATQNAFAALKDDGSVVIWGNTSEGGAIVDEGNPGHLLNWLTVVDSIPNNSALRPLLMMEPSTYGAIHITVALSTTAISLRRLPRSPRLSVSDRFHGTVPGRHVVHMG
jgi:hypothetical protein